MRWTAVLAGAMAVTGWADAAAHGARVAGRVVILEKDDKPPPDVGSAVVYLEGSTASPSAGLAGTPATLDILIHEKVYRPRVIVAPAGSTVRFPNQDPFKHNVFSVSEPNTFDLGLYGQRETKAVTLTRPGLVRVYCNVHPRMVAYVVVTANRLYAQPGADGSFAIDDVPPGRYRLHVWHERIAAEVVKDVVVTAAGAGQLQLTLNARAYRWQPHKNKYGREYPTSAGRERY